MVKKNMDGTYKSKLLLKKIDNMTEEDTQACLNCKTELS